MENFQPSAGHPVNIILVADIYGKTVELEEIANILSIEGDQIIIIDPYRGYSQNFLSESSAYRYFMENVELQSYGERVLKAVVHTQGRTLLIGFSMGASAIWSISDKLGSRLDLEAICFYGSQIRDYASIYPLIKIELIFPEHESHFSVTKLITQLSGLGNKRVTCQTTPYSHGFMNRLSDKFNQRAYEYFLEWIHERQKKYPHIS